MRGFPNDNFATEINRPASQAHHSSTNIKFHGKVFAHHCLSFEQQ